MFKFLFVLIFLFGVGYFVWDNFSGEIKNSVDTVADMEKIVNHTEETKEQLLQKKAQLEAQIEELTQILKEKRDAGLERLDAIEKALSDTKKSYEDTKKALDNLQKSLQFSEDLTPVE